MSITVITAFNNFLSDTVRLDSQKTKTARQSSDWLIEQIKAFSSDTLFPALHPDIFIKYGSFSRNTKIRPLDDVDLMIILNAQGATYDASLSISEAYNTNNAQQYKQFDVTGNGTSNSISVVNLFKEYLKKVPQYRNAKIQRAGEVVTLELGYDWVFDIVPCFITNTESNGRTYYLIPDGKGKWKKTDPRIDSANLTNAIAKHSKRILDVVRLMKFWNGRPTMPSIKSYMLEVMVVTYYSNTDQVGNYFPDIEAIKIFNYLAGAITQPVYDPKGIQGDLNDLNWEEKNKIRQRSWLDYNRGVEARNLEIEKDDQASIAKWKEIFGSEFPNY